MSSSTELFKNLFRNAAEAEAKAPIMGHLPDYVTGRVIYNGCVGKWDFEKESAKHWFDGQSILTSFQIDREEQVRTILNNPTRTSITAGLL